MMFSHAILYVSDVVAAVKFYERAFRLTTKFIHEENCYAEMETGTTTLAFASYELSTQFLPEALIQHHPSHRPQGIEIALDTKDVDAAYTHAISQGAISVNTPSEMPWGQQVARVKDTDGILVSLNSPMK